MGRLRRWLRWSRGDRRRLGSHRRRIARGRRRRWGRRLRIGLGGGRLGSGRPRSRSIHNRRGHRRLSAGLHNRSLNRLSGLGSRTTHGLLRSGRRLNLRRHNSRDRRRRLVPKRPPGKKCCRGRRHQQKDKQHNHPDRRPPFLRLCRRGGDDSFGDDRCSRSSRPAGRAELCCSRQFGSAVRARHRNVSILSAAD